MGATLVHEENENCNVDGFGKPECRGWKSWILFKGEIRKPDEEFRVWKSDLDVKSYVLGAARMHEENENCNVDGFGKPEYRGEKS
jgi:hypothetical protein